MIQAVAFWTLSGTIDLAALRPQDLTAEILGDALAKLNRFGGRTREPWSVAAHSVLVEHLCPPDLRPWALLHDAHEAFVGDMTTPSVEYIGQFGRNPGEILEAITGAKGRIDRAIGRAWGTAVRSMNAALRRADQIACLAEAANLLGVKPARLSASDEDLFDSATAVLGTLPIGDWRPARDLWLSRVRHYASLGLLALPRTNDPADMVSAG